VNYFFLALEVVGVLVGLAMVAWGSLDLLLDCFGSGVAIDLCDYPALWFGLILVFICSLA
jgi:hypothetical protein